LQEKRLKTRFVYFDPASCSSTCPPSAQFGDIRLQIYHPTKSLVGATPKNAHDADLVVRASYGKESILLAGDLGEEHEQEMLAACPPPDCSLQSDILQVPHHGSNTGLSPPFLSAVQPSVALIPVGAGNTFGHPGTLTLQKLAEARIPVYRTDQQGQIHLVLYPDHFTVKIKKPG
ncbi:hypothetical protein KGQ71_04030, partial [Patescibacteria group bacterium]|nr:hypothetical protein [Patescibacteria group bacterium]